MLYQENGLPQSNPQYPPYGSPHRHHRIPPPHLFASTSSSKISIGPNGAVYGMGMNNGRSQPNPQPNPSFNFPPHPSPSSQAMGSYQQFPSPPHPIPSPPPSQQQQYPYSGSIIRQNPPNAPHGIHNTQGHLQSSNIPPTNILHDGQITNPSTSSTMMLDYGRGSNTSPDININTTNLRNNLTPPGSLHISSQINPNSSLHRSPGIQLNAPQSYPQQNNSYVTPRANRSGSQILLDMPPRMHQDYNTNNMTPNSQALSQESPIPRGSSTTCNGNLKGGNVNNPAMNYNIFPSHSQPHPSGIQTSPSNQQQQQQQQQQ